MGESWKTPFFWARTLTSGWGEGGGRERPRWVSRQLALEVIPSSQRGASASESGVPTLSLTSAWVKGFPWDSGMSISRCAPWHCPKPRVRPQELKRLGRWQRPARGENPLPAGVSIRTDPGSQELLTEQSREQAAPSQQACPCLLLAGKVLRPACKRQGRKDRREAA